MIGDEGTDDDPMIRCSNPECGFTFCSNCKGKSFEEDEGRLIILNVINNRAMARRRELRKMARMEAREQRKR